MDELERGLTPTLATYSSDPRHMALVREECRKNVAQFIRDWLLKERQRSGAPRSNNFLR